MEIREAGSADDLWHGSGKIPVARQPDLGSSTDGELRGCDDQSGTPSELVSPEDAETGFGYPLEADSDDGTNFFIGCFWGVVLSVPAWVVIVLALRGCF